MNIRVIAPLFSFSLCTNACKMQVFYSDFGGWSYLLVLAFSILVRGQGQSCYFRDGSPAAYDTPCSDLTDLPGAAVPCCGPGFSCLDNRLCYKVNADKSPNLSRGSCTDRSWQSGNCPQMCSLGTKIPPLLNHISC